MLCEKFCPARVTLRAAIVAKDARQSDDEPIDDASSGASSPDAALTGDANKKARSGPKPKPATEASDIQGLKYPAIAVEVQSDPDIAASAAAGVGTGQSPQEAGSRTCIAGFPVGIRQHFRP